MHVLVRLKLMADSSALKPVRVYSPVRDTARSYVVIQTYLTGGTIYNYACLTTNMSHLMCAK